MTHRLCRRAILSSHIRLGRTELTWIHRDGTKDPFIRLKLGQTRQLDRKCQRRAHRCRGARLRRNPGSQLS